MPHGAKRAHTCARLVAECRHRAPARPLVGLFACRTLPKPLGQRRRLPVLSRIKPSTPNQRGPSALRRNLLGVDRETNVHRRTARSPSRPPLTVYLAAPRGFCAGVDRAIQIVELALAKYGAPVYVRHEIVHNRFVVDSLKAKGAVFVEELDDIPETDQPVIFSAHGVPKPCRRRPGGATCSCSMPPARWSSRCISRPPGTTRRAWRSC